VPITNFLLHPDRTKMAFTYPALLVVILGACALVGGRRAYRGRDTAVLSALFGFPVVHIAALCLLSDWPLWPWYYYSLTFAVLAGLVVLLGYKPVGEPAGITPYRVQLASLYAAAILFALYVAAYSVGKKPPAFALFSGYVGNFAQTHPGTYAMGDCAGSAAFLSNTPIIQLEGLMMDKPYVALVRAQTPLPEILRRYHADYYATIENPISGTGCFIVHEPAQAGPASPKMLGKICVPPLSSMRIADQSVGVFHASDVLVP
jgi:hypothetical protein